MKKLSLEDVRASAQRDRHSEEVAAQNAATNHDARQRLRLGKTKQVLLRMTPERYQLLVSLAAALSAGRPEPVSLTATMEIAIDTLEAKLKGGKP